MLVDSHCHLDFPDFAAEREAIIARARSAGVETMLTIGTRLDGFPGVRSIAEASRRTLTASTAPPAETPSRTVNARAASTTAARKNAKRLPPNSAAGADHAPTLIKSSRNLAGFCAEFAAYRAVAELSRIHATSRLP